MATESSSDESGASALDIRMSGRARLFGFGANAFGTAVSFGCSAIAAVVLGRSLGPAGFTRYGICSVVLALGIAVGLFSFGLHLTASLRRDADDGARAEEVLRATAVMATAVAGGFALIGVAFPGSARFFGLLIGLEIVASVPQVVRGVLDVRMQQARAARVTVASRLLWLILVATVVALPGPTRLLWVLAARVMTAAFDSALVLRTARVSLVKALVGPWERKTVASHIRQSAPLAGAAVLSDSLYRIDQPILDRISGAAETGLYVAGARIADLLGALAPIVANVYFPGLLELHRRGDETEKRSTSREQLQVTLLLCGVLCAVVVGRAEWLVTFLFGSAYSGGGAALGWLAVAEWTTLLTSTFNTSLMAAGRRLNLMYANAAGIAVNLVAIAALVPQYGAPGAAAASAGAYAIVALWMLVSLPAGWRGDLLKTVLMGAATFAVAAGISASIAGWIGVVVAVVFHSLAIGLGMSGLRRRVMPGGLRRQ